MKGKKVLVTLEGQTYESISEASRQTGIPWRTLEAAHYRGREDTNGKKVVFQETKNHGGPKPRKVRCLETDEVFDSVKDAAEAYCIAPTYVYEAIRKNRKTLNKFHRRYV